MSDVSTPTGKPSWRARRYGYYRSQQKDLRAYLFADRHGRQTIRTLWKIKRLGAGRQPKGER